MAGETSRTLEQMNAAQQRTIIELTNEIKTLAADLKVAQVMERFVGHLLDQCEGQTVTEENLQGWLASMLEQEKNGKV